MGLSQQSTGKGAMDPGLNVRRQSPDDRTIALAGNPNVGKSTVFNALTGMRQHTGNWPGKTVLNAQGYCLGQKYPYVLVDIPGTYSLMAHSAEEEVARNYICFGQPDGVVVVCDATCLERNLNLVLQVMEISGRVLVCVNLMDEARRKGVSVDLSRLSHALGVPVIGTVAHKKASLCCLLQALDSLMDAPLARPLSIAYPQAVEEAIGLLEPQLQALLGDKSGATLNARWLSLRLLDADASLLEEINRCLDMDVIHQPEIAKALAEAHQVLAQAGLDDNSLKDALVAALMSRAEELAAQCVTQKGMGGYSARDRRLDNVLTGKLTGYPIMLLLIMLVFWLSITGANVPSALLGELLFGVQDRLSGVFVALGAPEWLRGLLIDGGYRVLAWVVSVMLPPMALFFPLFTLLEDVGYLPRIAYNLDRSFQKCSACGKQALCMCMGIGCNAAGVVGCRIIDSPRERLIAILTNNFMPCNGRFPLLIALISMFFAGEDAGALRGVLAAALLAAVIVLGVGATLLVSKLLSKTLLKGVPSSFTLELPSYRKPQIGKVIVRSLLDRTLFVLGRAVAVAIPAGLVIWLMANVALGGKSVLGHCVGFLDPFARLMGLDGAILMAFILGFPANEIVLPIVLMTYLAQGSLTELQSVAEIRIIFVQNGWTWLTAACTMLFSLIHWPCSTTLLTIRKETGSLKWTLLAFALPAALGMASCMLLAFFARLFPLG